MPTPYSVVFITAPTGAPVKKIAGSLLKKKLAACVNIVPLVQSHYWWNGAIESAKEALLIVKTKKALFRKLEAHVKAIHPYTVPEIISLPIEFGHGPYLRWVRAATKP